ncbi:uncharacterized protein F4817DRAFT_71527 [Daldinia loculata]|uniref:uncharacterized protein n=1 Tax=Daldinia loculata TaxID=103429 RepID=UPI0020C3D5C0|nr:uncharacterized protein F4817DRAFT_71527 [Daldinia loculata]KAI1648340.1 hypothetical protein F4817DRAFT_71527 [Daldinia loculata]
MPSQPMNNETRMHMPIDHSQSTDDETPSPRSSLTVGYNSESSRASAGISLLTPSEQTIRSRRYLSHGEGIQANINHSPTPDLNPQRSSDSENIPKEDKVASKPKVERLSTIASWWWWWEIGGSVLSLISISLIIPVLKQVDDQPVEMWPYSIRPNSMIAILTTITRTAMMIPIASCLSQLKWGHFQCRANPLHHLQLYDDASRGPWGCFLLLLTGRLKAVTAWGLALVTLVALAIEPTAQQMLEQQSRQALLTNVTAQIGRAGNYTSKAIWSNSIQGYGGPRDPNPDLLKLQTTIANGAVGSVQEVNFYCPEPAAKCTWDQFDTLAVCASFKDVTNIVNKTCQSGRYQYVCTFEFPEGEPIEMAWRGGNGGGSLFNTSRAWNNLDGVIEGVLNGVNNTDRYGGITFTNAEAFTITLDFCVRTYHGVVATPAGIQEANYTTEKLLSYDWSQEGAGNPSLYFTYDTFRTNSSRELFNISVSLRTGLFEYVNKLFSTDLTSPLTDEAANADFSFGEFMYHTNLTNFTKNIEDTLTNQIRSSAPGDNRDALMWPGQAFHQETYWRVHWPWIILPVAEVLITAVLLSVSIVLTRNQPLLKSSPLALLFHPLDGYEGDEPVHSMRESIGKLEELAKGVYVEFREDGHGLLKFFPVEDRGSAN